MRPGSYCRIGRSVKGQVVDPAELFHIVDLRLVMIPVVISLDDIKKIFLISNSDRIVVFICCRHFSALRSRSDSADPKHCEQDKESKKGCADSKDPSCTGSGGFLPGTPFNCSSIGSFIRISVEGIRSPGADTVSGIRAACCDRFSSEIIYHAPITFNT